MSVYMWLVVVALLARTGETFKCRFPDEYEVEMKRLNTQLFQSASNKFSSGFISITNKRYYNNKWEKSRLVMDYNKMIQFVIHEQPQAPCTEMELYGAALRGIPDSAVKVDSFPIPLPEDLPEGIEYWRFTWEELDESIVGVLNIAPSVCVYVVWGYYHSNGEFMTDPVYTIVGNYSLSILDNRVFQVPAECLYK